MQKYIMLGYIYGIGGFQTYMNNKLKLMRENGWEVYAISNDYQIMKGEMLQELKKFKNNRIYAFSFPYPSELSHRTLVSIENQFASMIDYKEGDELIIEAAIVDLLLWAEYFAQRFHGRSICCETSNRFKAYPHETLDFFHFKAQRHELLMMSSTGLHELFEGYIEYPKIDNNTVGALTQNECTDNGIDYRERLHTDDFDYVIGTVGWLDKGYYKVLIDEVIKFCKQNSDKKIQFIVVGKSVSGEIEKDYEKKASGISNLKLSMMGPIAPVPGNLVKLFDVSVSSYGCAMITDKLGVITVAMHDPEYIPLGVLSFTMTKPPYKTRVNHDKSICEMLTDVLINKVYRENDRIPYAYTDVEKQKEIHLKRIAELPEKIEYYDVMGIRYTNASPAHKIKVLLSKTLGMKATEKIAGRIWK